MKIYIERIQHEHPLLAQSSLWLNRPKKIDLFSTEKSMKKKYSIVDLTNEIDFSNNYVANFWLFMNP